MIPLRRLAGIAALLASIVLCLLFARHVPSDDGGLVPAGVLLLALGAILLRRATLPRSDRPA